MSVIIVEPSSSGAALLDAARRLGMRAHILSADDGDRRLPAALKAIAASLIRLDTNDADAVCAAAARLQRHERIDGIVPGFEYVVDVVAEAAQRLRLPGLRLDAARCVRDKLAIRQAMDEHGLAGPRWCAIAHPGDVERAIAQVGFPAVLKPTDGCGSLMVRRVDTREQLGAALQANAGGMLDMGRRIARRMILESYVPGPEFSVEGVVCPDGVRIVAVTEKALGSEPYFVEMGHVVDAALTAEQYAAITSYARRTVRAVRLDCGVFHAELRLAPTGPVLMEIAARLGGDRIYRLVELAKGISLPELMLRSYCGQLRMAPDVPSSRRVAGIRFLAPEPAGDHAAVEGLGFIRHLPGCEEVEVYCAPGAPVPAATDFRGRVGHVLFTAPDRALLLERLAQAANAIRFSAPSAAAWPLPGPQHAAATPTAGSPTGL